MLPDADFRLPKDFLTLGDLADAWITRHCIVPAGFARNKPFETADWQFYVIAHRYRIRPDAKFVPPEEVGPDNPPVLNQAFVYSKTLIIAPQKTGKGPLTAALVAYEACGPSVFAGFAVEGDKFTCAEAGCPCGWEYRYLPGEPKGMRHPSPLIQITGFSEDGAKNIYAPLKYMAKNGRLKHMLSAKEGFIRVLGLMGDADMDRIDLVTSSANSRLGNPITDAEQDELGLWTAANKMQDVADTQDRGAAGMGGRTHGWTNAPDPAMNSVAQQIIEAAEPDEWVFWRNPDTALRDKNGQPLSYKNPEHRRKIHEYVYAGSWWVNLDSIEALARKLIKKGFIQQAERFFGNRMVQGDGAYIPDGLWQDRTSANRQPTGMVTLGIDGSMSNDWTAIRAEDETGFRFTPTYTVDGETRPTIWNPREHKGRIPRSQVHAAVEQLMARYKVVRMYCDPYDWQTEIETWAALYGDTKVLEWRTSAPERMFGALNRYLTDLEEGTTVHSDCPTAKVHAGNAIKIATRGDRYAITKAADHQKIDVLMSDILAHEAAADARAEGLFRDDGPAYIWLDDDGYTRYSDDVYDEYDY